MRFTGTAASFRSQGPERDAEQEDLQRLAVLVAAVAEAEPAAVEQSDDGVVAPFAAEARCEARQVAGAIECAPVG